MANNSRREKGTGNIYQRSNGTWVGRLSVGCKGDGKPIIKYFSGKTEAEVKKKIREFNKNSFNIEPNKNRITVGEYIDNWLLLYKKPDLKRSSYDRLEVTAKYQVKPYIGMIQLKSLSSDDIQKMLLDIQNNGTINQKNGKRKQSSYSTLKKAHDLMSAVLTHATIKGDIDKNPMLLVKMPNKAQFETKEIRIFTESEARLILEESQRKYSTGTPVYIYGDAYILLLNTGIRVGELIGLNKEDYDKQERTLHIKRNIQSVKKRNGAEQSGGYELIESSTKTYSGNRIVPLNDNAIAAIERMLKRNPSGEILVCNSKGNRIPPDKLTRTFYRMLDNVGIPRTGLHSLRHTFASLLFANKVDVKTVSKLLGHASIQITLNTYVHLINEPDKDAVVVLDDIL